VFKSLVEWVNRNFKPNVNNEQWGWLKSVYKNVKSTPVSDIANLFLNRQNYSTKFNSIELNTDKLKKLDNSGIVFVLGGGSMAE